jgi:transposase
LPDNPPIERVVEPPPCACGKCGGIRLRKLGELEVVSKTPECEPRRWKIVEHVRERFSCRDCEAITEPPAPSRPIPRGLAGPSLLAMVLAAVYTVIETCKFNDVDPQAWLADVLARLPDHPASRIAELLPWNWKAVRLSIAA